MTEKIINLAKKIKKLCPEIRGDNEKEIIIIFFRLDEEWKKQDNNKTKLFWECVRECRETDILKKGELYDFSGFVFPQFEKIQKDEHDEKILRSDRNFWKQGEKVSFLKSVKFENCKFLGKTSFSFCHFKKIVDFSSSEFLGNTSFSEALFSQKTIFGAGNNKKTPVIFYKKITFIRSRFKKELIFVKTQFKKNDVNFQEISFSKTEKTEFSQIKNKNIVWKFGKTIFNKNVKFDRCFLEKTDFKGCEGLDIVVFDNCEFNKIYESGNSNAVEKTRKSISKNIYLPEENIKKFQRWYEKLLDCSKSYCGIFLLIISAIFAIVEFISNIVSILCTCL